jgi:hypothetical protein
MKTRSKWVGAILRDCLAVRMDATRGAVEERFHPQNAASFRGSFYAHSECRFVLLEIDFAPHAGPRYDLSGRLTNDPHPHDRVWRVEGPQLWDYSGGEKQLSEEEAWLRPIIRDCFSIEEDAKRSDLRQFSRSAGLSSIAQETYCHRECEHVRVDLLFRCLGGEEVVVGLARPPYLAFPTYD